jgi:hypothetical protein
VCLRERFLLSSLEGWRILHQTQARQHRTGQNMDLDRVSGQGSARPAGVGRQAWLVRTELARQNGTA